MVLAMYIQVGISICAYLFAIGLASEAVEDLWLGHYGLSLSGIVFFLHYAFSISS